MTAPEQRDPAPEGPRALARPAVSVVVCTRDGAGRIGPTIASVRAALDDAAAHGVPGELVLVDSASADGTRAVLDDAAARDPRVRVVAVAEPGLGRARNAGARAAAGRAVLFTDDDVRVPPHWVRTLGAPLLAGEADLVSGAVALAPALRPVWLTPDIAADFYAYVPEPPVAGREFVGANMGAAALVLAAVPFDEALGTAALPGGDDTGFRGDVLAAGFRERAVPGAQVEHHFDPDRLRAPRLLALARGYGRSEAWLAHRHRGERPATLVPLGKALVRGAQARLRRLRRPGSPPDMPTLRFAGQAAYHRQMFALRLRDGRVT